MPGPCAHDQYTCDFICPETMEQGSPALLLEFHLSKGPVRVTVEADSLEALEAMDALVLTPEAYDRFAMPFQIVHRGGDEAENRRKSYRSSCVKTWQQIPRRKQTG